MALGGLGVEPLADLAKPVKLMAFSGLAWTRAAPSAAGAGDEVDDTLGDAGLVAGLDDTPG